jgi:hypothetical protein
MSRQLVRLRASDVKRVTNARKNLGDPEKAEALALSRLAHQIHPLVATTDYTLIDGYRTLWGLELLNRLDVELDFILTDEKPSPQQIALMQGVSAIHREDWPLADQCEWVIELAKTMPGKDIAAELGVHPAMVSNWRSFERLTPEGQQAVRDGTLGLRDMVATAALPAADQPALLAAKLNGASAKDLSRESRERRRGEDKTDKDRVPSIKISLAGGVTVIIKGPELNLSKSQDALKAAAKEIEFAKSQNLGAKAAQAAWKDRAKPKPANGFTETMSVMSDKAG